MQRRTWRAQARTAAWLTFVSAVLSPGALSAVQILTIDTNVVSFTTPTAADYDAGYVVKASANTLTVDSDIDWKLQILGSTATWSCTGATCWSGKPRGDIEWRKSGGSYAALVATAATVATGTATSPGTEDVTVDFRVQLSWANDAPGAYDYNSAVFELSAL